MMGEVGDLFTKSYRGDFHSPAKGGNGPARKQFMLMFIAISSITIPLEVDPALE